MRLSPHLRLAAAGLVLAAACSDSPTQPSAPEELSAALSEMSLGSLVPDLAATGFAPSAGISPANCAFAASSQSFVCAPVNAGGITVNTTFTLLSASGAAQSAFDRATTAAIRTSSAIAGTMGTGAQAITVDGQQTMTLSGLLTGTHVLDGTQVMHMSGAAFAGGAASQTITTTTTISGLVLPDHAKGEKYPRAGSITSTMTGPLSTGLSGFTMTMVFNGTSKVDLTVTMGGITDHCVLDLEATSAAVPACFDIAE